MKFRVLEGVHEQNGRSYSKGDIVESPDDLTETFKLKFAKVPDGEEASAGKPKDTAPPRRDLAGPKPANAGARANVKADEGSKGNQAGTNAAAGKDGGENVAETGDAGAALPKLNPDAKPKGTEVTKNFSLAVDEDFRIFKVQGQHFVYDIVDMSTPVNKEGVSKDGVEQVIKDALKAQKASK